MLQNKIVIFPDIHGRDFWKEPFEKFKNDDSVKFIFLGDYLDPYRFEGIDEDIAWKNFKDILESFKEISEDRVVFLLGNHDLHYRQSMKYSYGCRRSSIYFDSMSEIIENDNRFKIAYECKGKTKRYLFTHAGVLGNWAKRISNLLHKDLFDIYNADFLNSLLEPKYFGMLWQVSFNRGGDYPSGSCVWADVHEHLDNYIWDKKDIYENINVYQIFGHTLSYMGFDEYLIENDFAMLDSKKAFLLDLEEECILEYSGKQI